MSNLTSHETDMTNDLLRQVGSPVRTYPLPGERVIFVGHGNDWALIVSAESFRIADGWLEFLGEVQPIFEDADVRVAIHYGISGISAPGGY